MEPDPLLELLRCLLCHLDVLPFHVCPAIAAQLFFLSNGNIMLLSIRILHLF